MTNRRRRGMLRYIVALLWVISACTPASTEAIPESIRAYYEQANEYQREVLADGTVTLGEYEGALLATKRCIEDSTDGLIEVTDPFPSADGVGLDLNVGWKTGDTEAEEERISAIARDAAFSCSAEYADYVEQAYRATHAPSESEIQDALSAFVQCLHDAGFEQFTEDTMRLELDKFWSNTSNEDSSAIGACVDAHSIGYSNLATEDD